MLVLALETSTPSGSVALARCPACGCPEILFQETFASARSHNALVFGPVRRALAALDGRKPDMLLVGLGPGSYTGIRIGIAAAHGLATGLGVPWAGWNSFASLDTSPRFHVLGDARRGGFFHAVIKAGRLAAAPEILPLAALPDCLSGLDGPVWTTDVAPLHPDIPARAPQAGGLAGFAEAALVAGGVVEPFYLRAPYITVPGG